MAVSDETETRPRGARADAIFVVGVFGVVIAATAALLVLDFEDMTARQGIFDRLSRTTDPVTFQRPSDGDNIRPYLPYSRPVAPDALPHDGRPLPDFDQRAPMTFAVEDGRIVARGRIMEGTFAAFERVLATLPENFDKPVAEVEISSPGGSVSDAMAIALAIRAAGFSTRIPDDGYCASACPIVFAGGVQRIAGEKAWIGVHRVYTEPGIFGRIDDGIGEAQRVAASIQDLLVDFGVDPVVWTHAMRTPKDQIYFFTADELKDLKLATEIAGEAAKG